MNMGASSGRTVIGPAAPAERVYRSDIDLDLD